MSRFSNRLKMAANVGLGIAVSLLASCGMEDSEAPSATAGAIVNGTLTSAKPAIGTLILPGGGFCSATLISNRHIITAEHCNGTNSLSSPIFFRVGGDSAKSHQLSKWYQWGPTDGAEFDGRMAPDRMHFDVAIAELATPVAANEATPIFVAAFPPDVNRQVTDYGFGCNVLTPPSGGGNKRFATFNFGPATHVICPGDSGGPIVLDSNSVNGAIWGVNSWSPGVGDIYGNASHFKEDILNVVRIWDGTGTTGIEDGFRRNGPALATSTTSSANACLTQCNGNGNCNSMVWDKGTHLCVLMPNVGDWLPDSNAISGISVTPQLEIGIDRPGSDYASVASANASTCSSTCDGDYKCAAFTFVSATGMCFLKNYAAIAVSNSGTVSGLKRTFEYYTDRPGSDISDYDLTFPEDVRKCQADCSVNFQCFSYTYRGAYFDSNGNPQKGHCWLKNAIVPPQTNLATNKLLISGFWRATPL